MIEYFQGEREMLAKVAIWPSSDLFRVGIVDDGPPNEGYAEHVCEVLYEYGFKGARVRVEIIDMPKLMGESDWETLGKAQCL